MTSPAWCVGSHQRIGTYVHVLTTVPRLLPDAERIVLAGLATLDVTASRFRPDSELSRLTQAGRPVPISSLLAELLGAALEAAHLTDGLVDPTLGGHLRAAGYDRSFAEVSPNGPAAVTLPPAPDRWRDVHVWSEDGVWWLSKPKGLELDLGATAKAWAADRLAAEAAALGTGVLVNLGGDVAVAGPAPEDGWPVEVRDRPYGEAVEVVAVDSGGLATSSTTARRWVRGGAPVHHVLDPRTGAPATSDWASVSVTAATCLAANTASTAAVVLGAAAPCWLETQPVSALLLRQDGTALRVGGWP